MRCYVRSGEIFKYLLWFAVIELADHSLSYANSGERISSWVRGEHDRHKRRVFYPQSNMLIGLAGQMSAFHHCDEPQQIGNGPYRVPRWYYNPSSTQCELFYWSGCCANNNNFETFQGCWESCSEPMNPCAHDTMTVRIHCLPQLQSPCTSDQFCHNGATASTTVCCMKPANIDRCAQPLLVGKGNSYLHRWYFDPNAQKCQSFAYGGLQGNENNFLSLAECEASCFVNPCIRGLPYQERGVTLQCTGEDLGCPSGYYCHTGDTPQSYACCQTLGIDPCIQIMDSGQGNAQLQRWYWNVMNRKCSSFLFRGLKGNQNNFISIEACERACIVLENPCSFGSPLMTSDNLLAQCSGQNGTCPNGYWCHIGAIPQTRVCCPSGKENVCNMPLIKGQSSNALTRWYFDTNTAKCQSFVYSGMKGNQNNFLTQELCESACAYNPCALGEPQIGLDSRWQSCNNSPNSCASNYWCHFGAISSTTVCCPRGIGNHCRYPYAIGEGDVNLERFYYDNNARTCQPFTYMGMKGNQNNFLTMSDCQHSCQPAENPCSGQPATNHSGHVIYCSSTNKDTCPVNFWCHVGIGPETTVCCPGATNPCSVPLSPGTGNDGLSRWYYSTDERACLPFQYNGRRGNQNNFESREQCSRVCPAELCLLSIDRGACNEQEIRYAFNRQSNQCDTIQYTGCGGNLNNFKSLDDCIATCGKIGF